MAGQAIPLPRQLPRHIFRQGEALTGQTDGGVDDRRQIQRPIALLHVEQARHRTGHANRQVRVCGQPFDDVTGFVQIQTPMRLGRRGFTVVIRNHLPVGQPNDHEAAAPDVAGTWIRHRQREPGGHRGIDGIAAPRQHGRAHFRGQRRTRRHHARFAPHRLWARDQASGAKTTANERTKCRTRRMNTPFSLPESRAKRQIVKERRRTRHRALAVLRFRRLGSGGTLELQGATWPAPHSLPAEPPPSPSASPPLSRALRRRTRRRHAQRRSARRRTRTRHLAERDAPLARAALAAPSSGAWRRRLRERRGGTSGRAGRRRGETQPREGDQCQGALPSATAAHPHGPILAETLGVAREGRQGGLVEIDQLGVGRGRQRIVDQQFAGHLARQHQEPGRLHRHIGRGIAPGGRRDRQSRPRQRPLPRQRTGRPDTCGRRAPRCRTARCTPRPPAEAARPGQDAAHRHGAAHAAMSRPASPAPRGMPTSVPTNPPLPPLPAPAARPGSTGTATVRSPPTTPWWRRGSQWPARRRAGRSHPAHCALGPLHPPPALRRRRGRGAG